MALRTRIFLSIDLGWCRMRSMERHISLTPLYDAAVLVVVGVLKSNSVCGIVEGRMWAYRAT